MLDTLLKSTPERISDADARLETLRTRLAEKQDERRGKLADPRLDLDDKTVARDLSKLDREIRDTEAAIERHSDHKSALEERLARERAAAKTAQHRDTLRRAKHLVEGPRAQLAAEMDATVATLGDQLARMTQLDRELATFNPRHHNERWPTGLDERAYNGLRMRLRDIGVYHACPADLNGEKAPAMPAYVAQRDAAFLHQLEDKFHD